MEIKLEGNYTRMLWAILNKVAAVWTQPPIIKLSKLDELDMQDIAGEVRTTSLGMYSCGPPHTDELRLDDQLEPLYSSSVSIEDITWKTPHPTEMDDRDWWRKRGREICAVSVTWWWWHIRRNYYLCSLFSLKYCISISLMSKVFANGTGDRGSILRWVIPKTQKMVLVATLFNTQHYKVQIKSKVEESREMSNAHLYTGV